MRNKSIVVDLDARRPEGRQRILERLFLRYGPDLRAFLVGAMGIDESRDLDDVVQEVFVRLAKIEDLPIRLLPESEKSPISYLITIAHNVAIDRERKRLVRDRYRQNDGLGQQEAELDEDSPEAIVLAGQELERVKKVIFGMKPKWRKAFILNRFKHRTYAQVAEEMDISVKQVEKYISQALYLIRRTLEDRPGWD